MRIIIVVLLAYYTVQKGSAAKQKNPPDSWPDSVKIFDSTDDVNGINAIVSAAYATNGGNDNHGQWSLSRFAFLFKPGSYVGLEVPVGYYTSVLGLGREPSETRFEGGGKQVYCEEGDKDDFTVGALDTFWREAANFYTDADYSWWDGANGMIWAVSQASPLRRVQIANDLLLFQYISGDPAAGYSSGGFLADSTVEGEIQLGSQQQFLILNSTVGGDVSGGAWNVILAGVSVASGIDSECTQDLAQIVVNDDTILKRRKLRGVIKPYIIFEDERFLLATSTGDIDFESVLILSPHDDKNWTQDDIDAWLFSPGIYDSFTDNQILMSQSNFVLLGLGLATLRTSLVVAGSGITVAGIIIDAVAGTTTLMSWSGMNGILTDVFFRIGNFDNNVTIDASANTGLYATGSSLLIENVWIWRADHDINGQVTSQSYPLNTAARIAGRNIDALGLAAEHALQFQVHWTGDYGTLLFFQTEYAYDSLATFDQPGYFVEGDNHTAYGVGVYAYFRDAAANISTAIKAPPSSHFESPFSVFLNGIGAIRHVLNGHGAAVGPNTASHIVHICTDIDSTSSSNGKKSKFPPEFEKDLHQMAFVLVVVAFFGLFTTITLMRRHAHKMLVEDNDVDNIVNNQVVENFRSQIANFSDESDPAFELSISLLGNDSQRPVRRPPPAIPHHLLVLEEEEDESSILTSPRREQSYTISSSSSHSNHDSSLNDDDSPSNRITL